MAEVDVTKIDEVVDLYRIDPGEFVEARAALVKELRAAKRTEEARAAVKLRKPTVPAWALDQVAAEQPELIGAALAAGDALEAATTETLAGDRSNLRSATEAERQASAAVLDAAATHVPTFTADHREKAAASLRAAISDDTVRAQLLAGLLAADHEPRPMGFAATSVDADAGAPSTRPGRSKGGATKRVGKKAASEAATTKGDAKAQLAAAPDDDTAETEPQSARTSKRKIRRVGTPSSAKRSVAPVDEIDAKRRAKEVARLQEEEAERRRIEAERAKERKRQQAALDAAAKKARTAAERLDAKARKAEDAAAAARAEADAAIAEATAAEAAASAGPPD
jgi:hypothetical protein